MDPLSIVMASFHGRGVAIGSLAIWDQREVVHIIGLCIMNLVGRRTDAAATVVVVVLVVARGNHDFENPTRATTTA